MAEGFWPLQTTLVCKRPSVLIEQKRSIPSVSGGHDTARIKFQDSAHNRQTPFSTGLSTPVAQYASDCESSLRHARHPALAALPGRIDRP